MTVHGSYNSYMVLKSGISDKSTKYMTAKFFSWSAVVARICNPPVQGPKIAAKTVLKPQDVLTTQNQNEAVGHTPTSSICMQV